MVNFVAFKSKRQFGVEVEINRSLSQSTLANVVNPLVKGGCTISRWEYTCNNRHWKVKPDSSCGDSGNRSDGGGFEVISSVGSGVRHLQEIESVVNKLSDCGAVVNKHCAFHCQVEIQDFNHIQAANLLAHWCKLEYILSHAVPSHRNSSTYCVPHTKTRKWRTARKAKSPESFWNAMKLKSLNAKDKRNAITLVNYHRTRSGANQWQNFNRATVELRLPESSLNAYDVKNWSRLFVHFVDRCANYEYPVNLKNASLEEAMAILGLATISPDDLLVLSPGLYETKCWLLYRIFRFSSNRSLKRLVAAYQNDIAHCGAKWNYDFEKAA